MKKCEYEVLSTFISSDGKLQSNVVLYEGKLFVDYIENEVLLKSEPCTQSQIFAEEMAENYVLGIKKI